MDPLQSRTLTAVSNSYAALDTSSSQCYTQNGWCFLSVYVTSNADISGWQKIGSIYDIIPTFAKDMLQDIVVSYDLTSWCVFRLVPGDGSIYVMPRAAGKTYIWTICFPYEDK